MKALLIHQGDGDAGGGQIQMNRLLTGLRRHGIEANILCKVRTRADSVRMPRRPRLEKLIGKVTHRIGLNDVHCIGSFQLADTPEFAGADIIDYHCLHSGFFSYLALPRLTAAKPAVFTFHDMWPMTGHCHTSLECERWKTGCGSCPHLDTYPPVRRDATALEWKLKSWVYARSRFTIIAPSKWLCDKAAQSLLSGFPIRHIPHGIDTELYEPMEKELCRTMLGIPKDKLVLLFAVDTLTRHLKGPDLLQEALRRLPDSLKRRLVLLLFGRSGTAISRNVDMPTVDLGYVSNDRLKCLAFSAADLFLHPTRADSFGLVLLESMASGTPVVSFRVGGVPEVVRHGETGLLADPENAVQFSAHIADLLEDAPRRRDMERRAREVVVKEFGLDLYTERYAAVYRETASERP